MTIYRNSLGMAEPKGSLMTVTGAYYWLSSTAVDVPSYKNVSFDEAVKALEADGWEIVSSKIDPLGHKSAKCVHKQTAKVAAKEKAELDAKIAIFKNGEDGFVRYGEPPKCGYSVNAATGTREVGVSVFRAKFVGNSYKVEYSTPNMLWSGETLKCHRDAYRVWGEVVGTGSDGEPVVKVARYKMI